QEELFHIFNDLHNANKQIILSSDRLPKAIPGLEKRLASRFEGGMMADVSKPDYETRVAILKSKSDENNVDFPENVIDYLASNIQTNIREMEGALNKLIITQNLNSKTIDLNLAKKLLNKIISTVPKKNIDANRIIKSVADFYGLKKEGLFSQSKKKEVVKPRQVAMYLLRKETTMSYSGIAEKFNRKDHTTIIYACKQIEAKIENDDNYKQEIDLIKQRIID
ncbi:MAG: chromosomal replication initiator protein DnaA, partial [Candidatus Pacebacteria bacterium]|nr:chromosomal replication initiator protein DnaA [Candidatus Paceibacterota bacterium]